MHDERRTANLLGATSLALTDLLLGGATAAAGVSNSGAASLVVLSCSSGLSVTELGRRVGLSQPAAARMVDGLEHEGLVERRRGPGRAVSVRLTRRGRQAARRLLGARATPLADMVGVLDESDQQALADLLEKLLTRIYLEVGSSELVCRLCDRAACTASATCPVGAAERAAQREAGR
jgi:MarR family transcriptional regulator, negative regulator of the multidrug operon emrRAB